MDALDHHQQQQQQQIIDALDHQQQQQQPIKRRFSDIKNALRQELTSMVDATLAGGDCGPGSIVYRELQEIDSIVKQMLGRLADLKKSHVLAALG